MECKKCLRTTCQGSGGVGLHSILDLEMSLIGELGAELAPVDPGGVDKPGPGLGAVIRCRVLGVDKICLELTKSLVKIGGGVISRRILFVRIFVVSSL